MTSAIGLMYQLESKADSKDVTDYQRSLLYLVLQLVAHIENYSDQVAGIGKEANVFSNIKSDMTKVQGDMTRMQKWVSDWTAAHKGVPPTSYDAMNDPTYKAEVAQFKTDYANYYGDTHPQFTDPKAPHYVDKATWDKCMADGMGDAVKNAESIGGTSFNLPVTGSKTIDQMVNNNDPDLGRALLQAANGTSTAFNDWKAGSGGVSGMDDLGLKFGTMIQNFDTDLSTKGNQLQQIDQSGQNTITATGTLMNVIIQHLAEHA